MRPSTRLGQTERAKEPADDGRPTASVLARQLKGDLDWITLKALAKERTHRYSSPSELAADVRRHLDHEPVLAGPPSAGYRLGKFVRRHRAAVVAGLTVLAALILGVIGTTIGLVRAQREVVAARQVSDVLVGVFEEVDPWDPRELTVTARDVLDRGVQRIEEELSDQPEVQARLLKTIAFAYRRLGFLEVSLPLVEKALATQRALLGDRHPEVAQVLIELGWQRSANGEYEAARGHFEEAVHLFQQAGSGYEDSVAEALQALGHAHRSLGTTTPRASFSTAPSECRSSATERSTRRLPRCSTPRASCSRTSPTTRRRDALSNVLSAFRKHISGPPTRRWPGLSTSLAGCSGVWGDSRRHASGPSARSRSRRRISGPSTPPSRAPSRALGRSSGRAAITPRRGRS